MAAAITIISGEYAQSHSLAVLHQGLTYGLTVAALLTSSISLFTSPQNTCSMLIIKDSNTRKAVGRRRKELWLHDGWGECNAKVDSAWNSNLRGATGQQYPRVTIDTLHDDVLLEIFYFYVDSAYHEDESYAGLCVPKMEGHCLCFASTLRSATPLYLRKAGEEDAGCLAHVAHHQRLYRKSLIARCG